MGEEKTLPMRYRCEECGDTESFTIYARNHFLGYTHFELQCKCGEMVEIDAGDVYDDEGWENVIGL